MKEAKSMKGKSCHRKNCKMENCVKEKHEWKTRNGKTGSGKTVSSLKYRLGFSCMCSHSLRKNVHKQKRWIGRAAQAKKENKEGN